MGSTPRIRKPGPIPDPLTTERAAEIVRAIAAEYRWPDSYRMGIETVRLTPGQIARLVGDYRLAEVPSVIIHLTQEGDNIYIQIDGEEKDRLLPTSEDTLFAASSDLDLRAVFEGPGPPGRSSPGDVYGRAGRGEAMITKAAEWLV